jgi:hypothetical protein
MCASPISFFRAGPPPPTIALLPDPLFFTRQVPIAAGAASAEAAAQIELAIEGISPFPLAQLYYGWFWQPGADHAFVFASYRRRFTTEQASAWAEAELVLPAFASVFGATVEPSTAIVIAQPEGFTAVHWDRPGIPAKVLCRPCAPEATPEERSAVRDQLLRALGGSLHIIDLSGVPVPDADSGEGEVVFRSGDFVSRLPAGTAAALDVRDKGELARLRAARRRDVMLWRVMLGCAAAVVILALGQLALVGSRGWQNVRVRKFNAQRPVVDKIMASDALAQRVNELATQRLLPLEMITELVGPAVDRKPDDVQITKMQTDKKELGLLRIVIFAQTANPSQMDVYRAALEKLPSVAGVISRPQASKGDLSLYLIEITFKPDALKPSPSA